MITEKKLIQDIILSYQNLARFEERADKMVTSFYEGIVKINKWKKRASLFVLIANKITKEAWWKSSSRVGLLNVTQVHLNYCPKTTFLTLRVLDFAQVPKMSKHSVMVFCTTSRKETWFRDLSIIICAYTMNVLTLLSSSQLLLVV